MGAGILQSVASVATLFLQPCFRNAALVHGWPFIELLQILAIGAFGVFLAGSSWLRWIVQWRKRRRHAEAIQRCFESPRSDGMSRSFSDGDLHTTPTDQPCRRRSELFPSVDDILIVDGAYPDVSIRAYQKEGSMSPGAAEGSPRRS